MQHLAVLIFSVCVNVDDHDREKPTDLLPIDATQLSPVNESGGRVTRILPKHKRETTGTVPGNPTTKQARNFATLAGRSTCALFQFALLPNVLLVVVRSSHTHSRTHMHTRAHKPIFDTLCNY